MNTTLIFGNMHVKWNIEGRKVEDTMCQNHDLLENTM